MTLLHCWLGIVLHMLNYMGARYYPYPHMPLSSFQMTVSHLCDSTQAFLWRLPLRIVSSNVVVWCILILDTTYATKSWTSEPGSIHAKPALHCSIQFFEPMSTSTSEKSCTILQNIMCGSMCTILGLKPWDHSNPSCPWSARVLPSFLIHVCTIKFSESQLSLETFCHLHALHLHVASAPSPYYLVPNPFYSHPSWLASLLHTLDAACISNMCILGPHSSVTVSLFILLPQ